MGRKYKSPAKLSRSILRLLEYKQAYLEDCWDSEEIIDEKQKKLIWKASESLKLTLNKNISIVLFVALPFGQKLATFQNMCELD